MTGVDCDPPQTALRRLGLTLPVPPSPAADYRPWILDGSLLFISGQLSTGPEGDLTGVLGNDASLADGIAAARLCALNLLSQMQAAAGGDLGRVQSVLKLSGYARASSGFPSIPQVLDGCSTLLVEVLGKAGHHARSAVGVSELPRDCLVEIDAVVRLAG